MTDAAAGAAAIRDFQETAAAVRAEIAKVVVGHTTAIERILIAFFAGGHVLIEGVPGIGKTLLVRSLADALGLRMSRIQFTVDLMPADVTGTRVVEETASGRRDLVFVPGPVFAHVVLADEINRATPKTQAALLEAMAEQQVTVAGTTRELPEPFFVLATLNPIEMEGTYRLPEAQLDRFFFKVVLDYPSESELVDIFARTTTAALPSVTPVLDRETAPARIGRLRQLVRDVLVAPAVERWVASLVRLTVPATTTSDTVRRHVTFGASPRGGQALLLGAKVTALLEGRPHVTPADVERVAHAALGHRLVLGFGADAAGVDATRVVDEVLAAARTGRAVMADALAAGAAAAYGGLGLHVRGGTGDRLGEHRVTGRPQASGLEIESYRAYAHGDDLRHLDWSALARLDVLVTRRFTAEREQPVHLLVDASASMGAPARDDKLGVARELAMALAWMALATHDPVRTARLGAALGAAVRRPADARRIAAQLCALAPEGAVALDDALGAHAARHREPATVVVVSDCMAEPAAIESGLRALRARRSAVVLLQVLGAGELDPARDFAHGVLADVESGATHPIVLTPDVRRRYDALLADHLMAVEAAARRHDVPYARLVTGTPVPDFVTGPLARLGLVRRR